jgi:hypothetical protein
MSKGNPIVALRLPPGLIAEVDAIVAGWLGSRGVLNTRSLFISEAIRSKLREESGEPMGFVEWSRQANRRLAVQKIAKRARITGRHYDRDRKMARTTRREKPSTRRWQLCRPIYDLKTGNR